MTAGVESEGAPTPAGGVRQALAARTEAALKSAALTLFERQGYLNTKITDITREAGRSAGSFYRHFSSKEALLEVLLVDMLDEADARTDATDHSGDFSERSAVRWHVALQWALLRRHRTVMVALQQAATLDGPFAQRVRALSEADVGHLADHLRIARDRGVSLPGDPAVVASIVTSVISHFAMEWLAGGEAAHAPGDDEEAIEVLTSFIAGGIGLQKPSAPSSGGHRR